MRRFLACLVVLLLAACATGRVPPVRYDFGVAPHPRHSQTRFDATIAILPIGSPRWLRTTALLYRLGYEAPASRRAYTLSQWVAPPGELLTLRLRQWVEAENNGVTLRQLPGDARGYRLAVALDTFAQVFSAPDQSRCVVTLRASLVEHGGEVVAQKTFSATRAAPSPDALGGVQGLANASDVDLRRILAWLAETLPKAARRHSRAST